MPDTRGDLVPDPESHARGAAPDSRREAELRLQELEDEQTALRRVATLVARGDSAEHVFAAVANEVGRLFGAEAAIARFEPDGSAMVVVGLTSGIPVVSIGTRWELEDYLASTAVYRTGRPARSDHTGHRDASGSVADDLREMRFVSTVAAPVVVEGRLWGVMTVSDEQRPLPPDIEERVSKFTELLGTAIANAESRAELAASEARARDLAAEQAALRRVATRVAEGADADELFSAVVSEVADVLDVPLVGLQRFDTDGTFTLVGLAGESKVFTVGSRWPVEDGGLAAMILATGRPARKTDYAAMPGSLGAAARDDGMFATVGVPILVEGTIWGFVAAASPASYIPDGTEERLARFTELVATAIANSQARERVARLAEEQAALRRVATLVARAPASEQLFSTVAREVATVLDVPGVIVTCYDDDGLALTLGEAFRPDLAGAERFLGVGTRMPPDPGSLAAQVLTTHGPARVDDFSTLPGTVGDLARAARLGSGCAGPIVINGTVWGKMCVFSREGTLLPAGTESRLNDFIDLLAAAIANVETRAELAASEERARELAEEQAALRRVATLVAEDVPFDELVTAVTREVGALLGADFSGMIRYEADPNFVTTMATWAAVGEHPRYPSRSRTAPGDPTALVADTGKPARVDDWSDIPGPIAEFVRRELKVTSSVGCPIMVGGRLWGALAVHTRDDPFPPATEARLSNFSELVATAIANASARAQVSRMADEQAALRRVATLVARGVSSEELFAVVSREVGELFEAEATVARFEADGPSIITVGQTPGIQSPVGTRIELEEFLASTKVYRTGRAARNSHTEYLSATGRWAEHLRRQRQVSRSGRIASPDGFYSTVGAPIVVEGSLWGVILVTHLEAPPPDVEERVERFAELVATAIANAESRAELSASEARARELAEEQAALRRVAELVARAPASEQLFSAVAREVASVLDVPGVIVTRYDADGTALTLGEAFRPDLAGAERLLGVGVRIPPDPGSLAAKVHDTQGPARIDDLSALPGPVGDLALEARIGSGCAGPIMVNGALWGTLCVFSQAGTVLPAGTESRLHDFVELVATAIANYEARAALAASEAHARELAEEQAALGRVATLVAEGASPDEVFSVVSNEVGRLFGSDQAAVARYDSDGSGMVYVGVSQGAHGISIGTRWPLADYLASTAVYRTGSSARMDRGDIETAPGPLGELLREIPLVSRVAAPVVVEGALWGVITVSDMRERLPPDTEERMAKFTELVATAIANAESRAELAASEERARELAREQTALRRVATLVAKEAPADDVFLAVAQEIEELLGIELVTICRSEPDGFLVVASRGIPGFPAGSRWPLDVPSLPASIYEARGPVRIDDFTDAAGLNAAARGSGIRSAVGVPIMVGGIPWGSVCAASTKDEPFPPGTEERLARFTDLLATSVSNAIMREELSASRARVIAAADEARRRIERDLHDGAQQRLVTLAVALRTTEATIPSGSDELRANVTRVADGLMAAAQELREISRGIHPAVLTEGGLLPALKALRRRSTVRVDLDVTLHQRLPDQVEVAAYYSVSEALTNASRHAEATRVSVYAGVEGDTLRVSIRDDGVGGADPSRGSGLTGLRDRIEAIGGSITIASPPGGGTRISVGIPVGGSADRGDEPSKLPSPIQTSGRG